MIVFARPRHNYQSYTDLWTLVEAGGFPLIYIDEIDPQDSDTVYIYSTPDVSHEWKDPKARIIFWLLEWYGDYWQRPGVAETWVSNRTFAEIYGGRFVPLGSHPMLGNPVKLEVQYDIAHMSYADIYRRRWLLDRLIEKHVKIAPNGWGEERDRTLRSTRAMLHIHQLADFPAVAPLRAAIAAAYALPLITENGWDLYPYEAIHGSYDQLLELIPESLKYGDFDYYSQRIYETMCHELRFDKVVRKHV